MPQTEALNQQDLDRYFHLVKKAKPGLLSLYDELILKGYRYSHLARQVILADSPASLLSIHHMHTIAEKKWGRKLSPEEMMHIEIETAYGYLKALGSQITAPDSTGLITHDISYFEAQDFHNKTLNTMGLGEEAWILNLMFKSMNEAECAAYWEEVLEASHSNVKELVLMFTSAVELFTGKL